MALKFLALGLISKKAKEIDEGWLLDLANLLPDQESVVTIKDVRDTQIIVRCFNRNRDLGNVKEIVSKVSEIALNLPVSTALSGPHGQFHGIHLGASYVRRAS